MRLIHVSYSILMLPCWFFHLLVSLSDRREAVEIRLMRKVLVGFDISTLIEEKDAPWLYLPSILKRAIGWDNILIIMGNKLGRRRQVVDEKYTKPQGLYPIKDVDYKKLRKLILESKLAPCHPGGDECDYGLLEECPICFLYYPTLNRSRCCTKSICTECFLQMKNPNSARPTQCPFCKASNYAVEFRGGKSKEERGMEQVEEQKVIEAKIRMRQQEIQEQEERMHRRQETSSSVGVIHAENINCSTSRVVEGETFVSSRDSNASLLNIQQNRSDEFDVDLEDIMVMEAVWLSIQEKERQNYPSYMNAAPEQYSSPMTAPTVDPSSSSSSSSSSSPSAGLACAIAALAERQQLTEDQSAGNYTSLSDILPSSSSSSSRTKKTKSNYAAWNHSNMESTSYANSDEEDGAILPPPLPPSLTYGDYVAGYTDAYASSGNEQGFNGLIPPTPPPQPPLYGGDVDFQSIQGPVVVPESFEEQMMLAMAVSLAEARSRTAAQGVAWH
ncbi:hypothetical protein V2J09_015275 [Rumex salicifolius]